MTRLFPRKATCGLGILPIAALALSAPAWPQAGAATQGGSAPGLRFQVPSTVSPEAAKDLEAVYAASSRQAKLSQPLSLDDWDHLRESVERRMLPLARAFVGRLGASTTDEQMGGIPVVRLRPAGFVPKGFTLMYLHGGAYTLFSAHSSLIIPALLAAATGNEVISVDYAPAPRATWRTVPDQVVAVWRSLLLKGVAPGSVAICGDSAGGGLAAASVLKMRDEGLQLPGALYLISPATDMTVTGDTYQTLSSVDPILSLDQHEWSANVYADPKDQKNPYVSPVYGDYAKPFPPTLIQGGTREFLLSNFVREYQAIRSGGHEAVLDLYEGMPHVFQNKTQDAPETRTAIGRAAEFLRQHLTSR